MIKFFIFSFIAIRWQISYNSGVMMKILLKLFVCVLVAAGMNAFAAEETVRLWDGDAPYAQGKEDKDIPTLTIFLPAKEKANGSAVIVCPGGGYWMLADKLEGSEYAQFLANHGVTAFLLKYRLASSGYRHPAMWMDAARAIRYVRFNSQKWGVDVNKVGIIGSSAGGHLVSSVLTHYELENPKVTDPIDRLSSRPDFGILCYPVITSGEFANKGTIEHLLGKEPSEGMLEYVSSEKQVDKNTPPCFIWHTFEDEIVPVENSLFFAAALRKAGVPFDLHIYEKGIHGLALAGERYKSVEGMTEAEYHPWTHDLLYWLKAREIIKE
ncbi:MAG: alpha/beta hydrolase [Verrucomicrobia bacterium]|nr:alpha/beta hydrolase [Verrucomicrobiota bacterium]